MPLLGKSRLSPRACGGYFFSAFIPLRWLAVQCSLFWTTAIRLIIHCGISPVIAVKNSKMAEQYKNRPYRYKEDKHLKGPG